MPVYKLCYLGRASMCHLASCEAEQAAPCDAFVPGSWQCTTQDEAVAQAFGTNAPKRRYLCAIIAKQAMHLRVLLPTERANRLHHATLCCFGSWQCITYADKCNIKRFALLGLVHPQSDACLQTVLPRECIYVSPGILRGLSGCTMRCFGSWQLAMHHAR